MNAKTKTKPRPHGGGSYKRNGDSLEKVRGPSKEKTPDHVAKAKAAAKRPESAKDAGETHQPAKPAGSDAKAKG